MADAYGSGRRSASVPRRASTPTWTRRFLAHLAETSNVTASAEAAGIKTGKAYERKRDNAEFSRQWRHALCVGYEALELELLHRLRSGEDNTPATKGGRKFDNAIAFRLLLAHRDEAGRQRAIRDNEDADAIFAAIDAKLDRMRERQIAASQPVTPGGPGDE